MTKPEQDDPGEIERDDALLDAVASGAYVDDPAAALLAQIAGAVDDAASDGKPGGSGGSGGDRRIRTIWGMTLGISVVVALGGGLGVAAYGQLSPHGISGIANGFVVPDVSSTAPGLGTVTVTIPSARRAAGTSEPAPELSGVARAGADGPWQLVHDGISESPRRTTARRTEFDSVAPLATTRSGETPRTYSTPVATYGSSEGAPAAAHGAPAPTRRSGYVTTEPSSSPSPSTRGRSTPSSTDPAGEQRLGRGDTSGRANVGSSHRTGKAPSGEGGSRR